MGKTGNVDIYVSLRYGGIYRRGDNRGESSITAVSSETTKTATTYKKLHNHNYVCYEWYDSYTAFPLYWHIRGISGAHGISRPIIESCISVIAGIIEYWRLCSLVSNTRRITRYNTICYIWYR